MTPSNAESRRAVTRAEFEAAMGRYKVTALAADTTALRAKVIQDHLTMSRYVEQLGRFEDQLKEQIEKHEETIRASDGRKDKNDE